MKLPIKKSLQMFVLMLFTTGLTMAQEGDGTLAREGDEAPLFKAVTIDGKTVDIGASRGKVVMITFFATWCGPCNQELPVLEKNIWERYKDRDDFVLIVLGREHNIDELKEFASSKNINLPFAPDTERTIFDQYASISIPRNVIIGRDGNIAYHSVGYTAEGFSKMEETLASMLK